MSSNTTVSIKTTTIPNLPVTSNPQPDDLVIIEHTEPGNTVSVTSKIRVADLFSNSNSGGSVETGIITSANIDLEDFYYISTPQLFIRANDTINPPYSPMQPKQLWFDDNYIYVTTLSGEVKRVALSVIESS